MSRATPPKFAKIAPLQLKRLLDVHFGIVEERSTREEITILCPREGCGDKSGNRSFNLKSNLTHCWRCGKKDTTPRIATLWLRHYGIEVDAADLEIESVVSLLAQINDQLENTKKTLVQKVDLPDGFIELAEQPTSGYAQLIEQMAIRKKLTLDDFIEARVGFTREGDWEPFAIFPVYELGKPVYYQGRTYGIKSEGSGFTKKFPKRDVVPMGASNWLYNFDEAVQRTTTHLIVVESILNVLSLKSRLRKERMEGVVPVAVFKHAVSPPQRQKLLASPAKEICFMYDGDATDSAWEEAKNLGAQRETTVAQMPVGIDANDDSVLAFMQFVERQRYSPLNAALSGLNQSLNSRAG